ncbi:MAG: hypothetical protein ACTHQ3_11870 [Motilibacteraceae bacterium]
MTRDGDRWTVAGVTLTRHHDTVFALPEGFPQRAPAAVSPELMSWVPGLLGTSPALTVWELLRACAHPVVVLERQGQVEEDATALSLHPACRSAGVVLTVGRSIAASWYRASVVLVPGRLPVEEVPWMQLLQPSLVVTVGASGLAGLSVNPWPDVPVVSLLARRRHRDVMAAEMFALRQWERVGVSGDEPGFVGGAGVEVSVWREPTARAQGWQAGTFPEADDPGGDEFHGEDDW